MDLQPCFKVHNLASIYHKNIKPGQMTTFDVVFCTVVPDHRFIKLETRSSSLRNFGMADCKIFRTKRQS